MDSIGIDDLTCALNNFAVTCRVKRDEALARERQLRLDADSPRAYPFRSRNLALADAAKAEADCWETMRVNAIDGVLWIDRVPAADLRRIEGFDLLQAACFRAQRIRMAPGTSRPTRDAADFSPLPDVNPDGQGREGSPPAVPKGAPAIG